jgi:endonuclease-3
MKINKDEIASYLNELYPEAHCELNYDSIFHLLIAVMLSAQTTDASVNKVTPKLFDAYPTPIDLMNANLNDVENLIRAIGLYKNKAKNIIATSKELVEKFNSTVPSTMEELTSLPGVGRKTANVVLVEGFKIPAFPVDTHVERVSKRLGIAKQKDSVDEVERKIRKIYKKEQYGLLHHQFIFFGRYFCKAIKPNCQECRFLNRCFKK